MRLFDCILYNGEIETLEIRLHELDAVVDIFVIVEATQTFSGLPKPLHLRAQWDRIRTFAQKIRYIVLDEDEAPTAAATPELAAPPPTETLDPWGRERLHRNSIVRGLLDAEPADLILISDVDEIPRAQALQAVRAQVEGGGQIFGLVLTLSYFALNYVHTAGPEVDLITAVLVPHALLAAHAPDTLRHAIRGGAVSSIKVPDAGWHFSYLADRAGIIAKIRAFSHQEYNTPDFLGALDPDALIAGRKDLFGRAAYSWTIAEESDLPDYVRANPSRFAHRILTTTGQFKNAPPPVTLVSHPPPVILCPYVHEADRARFVEAFGLETERGRHLPVHLWQDKNLQGPERAYAEGWARFPDHDVIILHTDMAPLPEDTNNDWYPQLLAAVEALPAASLIGCDLLYPLQVGGQWYVQCAGGWFRGDAFGHVGGHVDLQAGAVGAEAVPYDDRFAHARRVDWVTFGGVYLRREILDMVGEFDPNYRWAYVMDTDFALEATVRGAQLYQVPITLLHEENGSTRTFLRDPRYSEAVTFNYAQFRAKWSAFLNRRATTNQIGDAPVLAISDWRSRMEAAVLAEAYAQGAPFREAAYLRALAVANPEAVTLADIEAAYQLILDRALDPGARNAWQGEIARGTVRASELVAQLNGSAEFESLARRHGAA